MLKNSETFLNIFMFSPTLVVEVLYEVLEIIVFIGFKDGFNDKVEVFDGIVGGGYCRGSILVTPPHLPQQAPAVINHRSCCQAGSLATPGFSRNHPTTNHYDPLGGGPPMFHGVVLVVWFPEVDPQPACCGFPPFILVSSTFYDLQFLISSYP